MVKTITNTILALAIIAFVAILLQTFQAKVALSGVDTSSEYNARTYTSAGTSSLKSIGGTLGNIVVSSTSPVSTSGVYMAFYDVSATTTATTSMTAKMTFGGRGGVTPPAGTYEFDVAFGNGIYVWVDPSFAGSYTITYR